MYERAWSCRLTGGHRGHFLIHAGRCHHVTLQIIKKAVCLGRVVIVDTVASPPPRPQQNERRAPVAVLTPSSR